MQLVVRAWWGKPRSSWRLLKKWKPIKGGCLGPAKKECNPFRKPWGVQTDGDLWEQAWKAVLKRGPGNQDLRKVKGHAPKQDVGKGKATKEDRHGNDRSDKIADEGVEAIGGRGLVKLGDWLGKRHDQYSKFMSRIQKMIAGIALAEKEERTTNGSGAMSK